MKPTSPLSLLLFMGLTSAAPIPSRDCPHHTTCQSWLHSLFSLPSLKNSPPNPYLRNDHTPPTHIPNSPHFPSHQLHSALSSPASHRELEQHLHVALEKPIDNTPAFPSKNQKSSDALATARPLPSSYLLSLSSSAQQNPPQSEPSSTSAADALPSKPTSALPNLREEDGARYWATTSVESREGSSAGQDVVSDGQAMRCGIAYLRAGQPMLMARDYSNLLVVGIVVLFLAAVVVLEAIEYFGDLRSAFSGTRRRRGEIFLEEEERHNKKSFSTLHAQASSFKPSLESMEEGTAEDEKSELYQD